LGKVYEKYGSSLSNRKAFSKNFLVLSTTTMFIITIVKTSLALSLGLVGALSIVRFRSAIKEPEELTYLFLNIAIGLGCGAGHLEITVIAFVMITGFIVLTKKTRKEIINPTLYLSLQAPYSSALNNANVLEILQSHASEIKLKRWETSAEGFEASFYISPKDVFAYQVVQNEFVKIDPKVQITFLDTSRDF
jgi:uncharacterized membrane protein YhiD involved in acid resistance